MSVHSYTGPYCPTASPMFQLFGQSSSKNKTAAQHLKHVVIVVWLALFVSGLRGHQGSILTSRPSSQLIKKLHFEFERVVVLDMAAMALFLLIVERVIFVLIKNALLCSLFGMMLVNTVAKFGVTPRQDVPYFLLIISFAVFICFLQPNQFTSVIDRSDCHLFNGTEKL